MDGKSFYDHVTGCDDLEWLGVSGQDEVLVRNKKIGATFSLEPDAIKTHEWDVLQQLLTGIREAKIMMHITRIVGYYSQIRNWNKSKLAELRDRHKGGYAIHAELPKLIPIEKVLRPAHEPALATA